LPLHDVVHGVQAPKPALGLNVPAGQAWQRMFAKGPQLEDGSTWLPGSHEAVHAVHTRLLVAVGACVSYSVPTVQVRNVAHTVFALLVQAVTW